MLTLHNAWVRYGSETALAGVSLTIQPRESVCILGASGCGKTSLLYAAAGLQPLCRGSIQTGAGRGELGLLFQDDRLLPWLTAAENVRLGCEGRFSLQDASAQLALLGLREHAHKYPDQLSGGQRQRAALARMLIRRPRLLLLDEPFAALDEQTRERLQQELLEYAAEHTITMLLVTHSITEAVFLGQRILVMQRAGLYSELENPRFGKPDAREHGDFYSSVLAVRAELKAALESPLTSPLRETHN